jgi:RNA polymerase sigma-70 factor (ECF subfamily)
MPRPGPSFTGRTSTPPLSCSSEGNVPVERAAALMETLLGTPVSSGFVARALARLSPAHREVLHVVYFADHTAVQAAKVLGLPVGTVKSRTYHALRRLKVYLEKEMLSSEYQ